ncbi:hypothetical protein ABZ471_35220 [Streptomyces sp. NPDC005728]|uniref:hypothetical protein n=1 Tax=Streptomyces sp. NPDC005728 TaxID=3157054 RepID=UPI003406E1D8
MPVDPSDPETFQEEDDAAELSQETPETDAAEQHPDVRQDSDDSLTHVDPDAANEADIAEQTRVVDLDEDDYR